MPDPNLSDVHADLVGRLKHDERIRILEQGQARLEAVIADMPRMEARLMSAIEAARPKVWAAVAALAAVLAVVLVIAKSLYGG